MFSPEKSPEIPADGLPRPDRDGLLLVSEIFHSLQGETSLSGLRFAFIRLSGCNLRCTYCDSAFAFKGGRRMSIDEVVAAIGGFEVEHILITGGEPLLQRETPGLARRLVDEGYRVSIETHGEVSIAPIAPIARVIMDIKTPSSEMCRGGFVENLAFLKPNDEVKFVIASDSDYQWAVRIIREHRLESKVGEVLFSPAQRAAGMPGEFPGVEPRWLAERILEDRLPVRLQLQLHKQLWGPDQRGV